MRRAEGDPETVGERGLKDVSHSNAAIVYQEPRTLFPVCAEAFWVKRYKAPPPAPGKRTTNKHLRFTAPRRSVRKRLRGDA